MAACAFMAVGAPAAHAGATYKELTAGADVDVPLALTYAAEPGANDLRVSVSAASDSVAFADVVATPVSADPTGRCGAEPPLTCTLINVETLDIVLGPENDTVSVGGPGRPPPTTVDGGAGNDRADYSKQSAANIALNGPAVDGVSFSSVEDATGSPGVDTITGSDVANTLVGLGGNDNLDGGLAGDMLLGGPGDDRLAGGDGPDRLHGGEGTDDFSGGAGDDEIFAADDNSDKITCGDGEDTVSVDAGPNPDAVDFDTCENVFALVVPDPEPSGPQPEPGARPQQQPVSSDTALRAPVPVLADGVAAPGDRTAPSARLRVPIRQLLTNALRRGVAVPVSCSEACGISVAVVLDRRTALKLDLAGRAGPAVLGTATARMAKAGTRRLRVRLTRRARRALRPAKSVRVTVQSLVSDAAGNGTLMQRRVTLRRVTPRR